MNSALARQDANPGATLLAMLHLLGFATILWWAFAFYPVNASTPEWLLVAQGVCFGVTPSGLPAPHGWTLLVLGPLSFLIGIKFIYADEFRFLPRLLTENRPLRVSTLLLVTVLAVGAIWVAFKVNGALRLPGSLVAGQSVEVSERLPENYPRTASPVPNFSLVNQHGQTVSPEKLRGSVVIQSYVFAHCASVCPMLVKSTLGALEKLGASSKAKVVFITLDPWRDTPSDLPSLAEEWKFPPQADILSGSVKDVSKALDDLKVPWRRNEKNGEVVHPALVHVIDQSGRIAFTFNNPSSVWLADAVQRLE